jgi:ADP-ribose pyrophosphatase
MQADRILQGEVFGVDRVRWTDPVGAEHQRLIVRHPGAVTVVPELADGRLVLIRNWRVSVQSWLVEFCAGKLEPGEAPALAAARELQEETGHRAGVLRTIGRFLTSPGLSDEWMHVFAAQRLEVVPRGLQPGERIEVLTAFPEEVEAWIRCGEMQDGKSIAAYALWKAVPT